MAEGAKRCQGFWLPSGGRGPFCGYTGETNMRILALDVGDVRIGVALSDETQTLATGLPTYVRVGPRKDVKAVKALVRDREAGELVVGLPKNLSGEIGPQAEKVLAFVEDLRSALPVPVVTWDERFTTALAERTLIEGGVSRRGRREVVDQVAAVLILQSYLDARPKTPAQNE
jgi:putative Holliday junction resolvase